MYASAEHASLKFLVGSKPAGCEVDRSAVGNWHRASHQSAVVSPIEAKPRTILPRLILHVRGLVEPLVVVDAERSEIGSTTSRRDSARTSNLRIEEA